MGLRDASASKNSSEISEQNATTWQHAKFQTLASKNHPTTLNGCNCFASGKDNREKDFRRRSAFKESDNLVPIYGEQLQYTHFLQ